MSIAVPTNSPREGVSFPSIQSPNTRPRSRRQVEIESEQAMIRRLETDDGFLERAVRALYRLQEPAERRARMSMVRNGAGFSKPDALTLPALERRSNTVVTFLPNN